MQVQGSILIRRKAKDAVSVSVSPESIALKRSDKQQTVGVTVGVTVGNTALPYYKSSEACFVCGTPKGTNNSYVVPDALKWSYDTRTGFVMKFTLLAGKEVNIDVKFDVTYYPQGTNNAPAIKWEKTVSIVTCKDGDKGDKGDQGDKGIPGLIVRTTEWAAGVEYHNDENLTGGIRYLDVAMVTNSKTGLVNMFQCRKTHVSTDANKPQAGVATAEWKAVNMERMPIYTPLIIADNAVLRFGQTNRILITNSKQNVQGCFGGVEDEVNGYPLWIGAVTAEKAKCKVTYEGQLYATEANISGNINATSGTFNNVTISSGKIAGFSISGNGLTNDPFTNDAYVVFRNDSKSCFAGIGGNVLPTSSGLRSVARFENNDDTNQWGLDKNIAMYLSAKNGTYNYAFVGSGNGILDGCICGIGFETVTNNKEKTVFVLNPTKSLFFFASDSSKNGGIGLPTLSSLRAFLGVSDTKEFCVAVEIVLTDVRSDGSFIYGRNTYIKGMDTDEYPTANWNQKKSKYGESGSGWVDNYFIAGYNKVILHYRNGEYMATLAQSTIQTEVHST